jgi:hypothetical protein
MQIPVTRNLREGITGDSFGDWLLKDWILFGGWSLVVGNSPVAGKSAGHPAGRKADHVMISTFPGSAALCLSVGRQGRGASLLFVLQFFNLVLQSVCLIRFGVQGQRPLV